MDQMSQKICVVTNAPVAATSSLLDFAFFFPISLRNNMTPTSFSQIPPHTAQAASTPSADVWSYLDQHGNHCEAIRYFIELGLPPINPQARRDIIHWCFKHDAKEALIELFRITGNAELVVPYAQAEERGRSISLVRALLEENAITSLCLRNQVGFDEEAARQLATGLNKNSSLTSLAMDCCFLDAAAARTILRAITAESGIRTLDFSGTPLPEDAAHDIAQILRTCKVSKLHLVEALPSHALHPIVSAAKENKALRSLALCGLPMTKDKAGLGMRIVELLTCNPDLAELSFSPSQLADQEFSILMVAIAQNSQLNRLVLLDTEFDEKNFANLRTYLEGNHALESLDLSRWSPSEEDLLAFAESMEKNKNLLAVKFNTRMDPNSPARLRIETAIRSNKLRHWELLNCGIFNNAAPGKELPPEMGMQILHDLYLVEKQLRGEGMAIEDLAPMLLEIRLAAITPRDQMTSSTSATSKSFDS